MRPDDRAGADLLEILVVGDDPKDAQSVRDMLEQAEAALAFQVRFADSVVGALDLLGRQRLDAVLFDPLGRECYGLQGLHSIRTHAANVPVLVWTNWEDPAFAEQAIQGGAHDCLIKDRLNGAALSRALHYAILRQRINPAAPVDRAAPVLIGVLGAKGGVGTTTLACHISAELRLLTGQPVLLADLDLYSGQAAFLMKANSPHSLADALANVHRLDPPLWSGLVGQGSGGVDVIASPAVGARDETPEPSLVRFLFRVLRAYYPWIVVDLARLTRVSAGLMPDVDQVLLVTTSDVQSLLESRRVLAALPEADCRRERVRLLLNRLARRSSGTSPEEVEKLLSLAVYGALADSPRELAEALVEGVLLPRSSELGGQITDVTARLAGLEPPRRRGGVMSALASRVNAFRTEKDPAVTALAPEP